MMSSTSTEITLDSAHTPQAWNLTDMPTSTEDSVEIAPWLAPTPPSPPRKGSRFNLASVKVLNRQGSSSSVFARPRASESTLAESFHSSSTGESSQRESTVTSTPKSFYKSLKRSFSRHNLEKQSYETPTAPLPTVSLPDSSSFASTSTFFTSTTLPVPPSPPPPLAKKARKYHKQKSNAALAPPPRDMEHGLADVASMDRILKLPMSDVVHPSALEVTSHDSLASTDTTASPTFEDFGPETGWISRFSDEVAPTPPPPPPPPRTTTTFTNPFSTPSSRRKAAPEPLRVSPTSALMPVVQPQQPRRLGSVESTQVGDDPASWTAPESWAVPREGDEPEEPDYTSSEEEDEPRVQTTPEAATNGVTAKDQGHDGKAPPPPRKGSQAKVDPPSPYKIRIHRYDGAYHVVSCPLDTTVAQLQPVLHRKLSLIQNQNRETHKLYLRERGRERLLAPTERPALIVRRRLEHAGYNAADDLENLGADEITFLLKFVFRGERLGGVEEQEVTPDSFEYVDLTGKSLRTVPIVLHQHAQKIILLNLSKNPLLEIPLDFIQSCETLRELRLSNMAMKKVPQSVRHSASLHRLDLSCNRIVDLDEAGLDRIPELLSLKVQNNRLERLPPHFRDLNSLRFLNISNNKFEVLPSVVCEMKNLVDLDVSFNMISELPPQLGQLSKLERLVIVGNQVSQFPGTCSKLARLSELDCRRNNITDLSVICRLPKLETLRADYNMVHALDLSLGPSFKTLQVTNNDITRLALVPGSIPTKTFSLTHLDISHAKLSSLDDFALAALTSLTSLKMDYNSFRSIPDVLCTLAELTHLSCSDNELDALPADIGQLQKLVSIDAHNNNLTDVPRSIWHCGALEHINMTTNLITSWQDPPAGREYLTPEPSPVPDETAQFDRKMSSATLVASHPLPPIPPPLARSLKRLYLGDNRLDDDVFHPLNLLKELTVLNLSFNEIQEIPPFWLQSLSLLEELYLSGNKLTSVPSENLYRLTKLTVLFLNGNKLQTLPAELGKVKSLAMLDVGSNMLKYNVNNWEFDWNWNFNPQLRYLNLSGNKRLEIKPDNSLAKKYTGVEPPQVQVMAQKQLAEFTNLKELRVLGLMDVTTLFMPSIPDESEDRRVRTSFSEINGMAYGIADTLGKLEHVSMFDLVLPRFRGRDDECLFGMFGRVRPLANNNKLTKYLHENFQSTFIKALDELKPDGSETVGDAMRRAFLALNKNLFDHLTSHNNARKMSTGSTGTGTLFAEVASLKTGASAVIVYMVGKTMYVANAGNALAVVSRQGMASLVSMNHEPFNREETARIRSAEGWVSPKGMVNDEVAVSRSFGYYQLLPAVNPRPFVREWCLSEQDEFVIIGNRGLWDYVSYQTAVDIARNHREDPMMAAQKLRDFAMSYGADGGTMIMVISFADLFKSSGNRLGKPAVDVETTMYSTIKRARKDKDEVADHKIARLEPEVEPPRGHVALVFTDIRNSTFLWDKNAGMATAMKLHNHLLRRLLRFTGGYEVKTEGDAFMVSFSNVFAALEWCFMVQVQLMHEPWPLEILECEDGKEIRDTEGRLIARGLSVRMGMHCGTPYCERDPVTRRMDYLGPMVNRTARICQSAAGGQIMCNADVIKELTDRVLTDDPEARPTDPDLATTIEAIRRRGVEIVEKGETRMKGLEIPELLSHVYPGELVGRIGLKEPGADGYASADRSRVQFSEDQMKKLAHLCLRLETLSSKRVFRPLCERKPGADAAEGDPPEALVMYADPNLLIPSMKDRSDQELTYLLDSLSVRIDNALSTLHLRRTTDPSALASF